MTEQRQEMKAKNADKPDVELSQHAHPEDADGIATVTNSAHCRFCVHSYMTPDVREAIKWADAHEVSLGHLLAKNEAISRNGLKS